MKLEVCGYVSLPIIPIKPINVMGRVQSGSTILANLCIYKTLYSEADKLMYLINQPLRFMSFCWRMLNCVLQCFSNQTLQTLQDIKKKQTNPSDLEGRQAYLQYLKWKEKQKRISTNGFRTFTALRCHPEAAR